MTRPTRQVANKMLALVTLLAVFATACGGAGPSSEQSSAATTAANTNQAALQLTGDVATTQLLDTADGAIAQLSNIVTGDRPVLLWYWAPH